MDVSSTVAERVGLLIGGVLRDETRAVVPAASITTFTLTLTDRATDTIINGRNDTNILNANGGTLDASGNWTFLFTPADNQIVNADLAMEEHIALFEWTWSAGAKRGQKSVLIRVKNYGRVP